MKNISALTFLVIMLSVFSPVNSAYSQEIEDSWEIEEQIHEERTYGFSIAPQAGIVYGQALEYVYPNPANRETMAEFLSELIWDMKPVFYLGLQLDFGKKEPMSRSGFFSSLSFKAGIPGDSGVIEDSDWQDSKSAQRTDFSSHTNKTRQFIMLDIAAGFSIPLEMGFLLKPFISGSWSHFAYTGRGGHGKYEDKPYPLPANVDYTGYDVISYKQDWLLFSPGVSVSSNFFYPFSIALSLKASLFTYCASEDVHHGGIPITLLDGNVVQTTQRTYLDYSSISFFCEPSVSFSYSFKRMEHSLEFSYRHISKTKGDSYDGTTFELDTTNKTGAGLSFMDLRYLVKIKF